MVLGVALRSSGLGPSSSGMEPDKDLTAGIAYTIASAAMYSLLGVFYEVMKYRGAGNLVVPSC